MTLPPSSPTLVAPHTISHSGSLRRRRTSSDSHSANSPEFEFWRIPSAFPQSPLHSADELFSDGFLLPLHHLHQPPQPNPKPDEPEPDPDPEPGPVPEESEQSISAAITSSAGNHPILTASKRWKEIFKRGEKKSLAANSDDTPIKPEKSSEKKREKIRNATGNNAIGNVNGNSNNNNNNNNNGGNNSGSAELNINLWPFSRSRSAGNNSGRSKPAGSGRKVSSAPCSRSNSSGESKSSRRSWPSSPGRSGVHLGRASPVVQLRRKPASNPAGKGRVLNLNVPMCIGYRQQLSCRSDEDGGGGGGGAPVSGGGGSGSNGNLFSLRGLFSKKSVLTT